MSTLEVFDRPLCCSTGICGPSVDPAIVRFAADLDWLKSQGVTVERYNLAHQPAPFAAHDDVKVLLRQESVACLPIIRVGGAVVSKGTYPDRAALAAWCGLARPASLLVASACCASGCCS